MIANIDKVRARVSGEGAPALAAQEVQAHIGLQGEAKAALEARDGRLRSLWFGHIADSNIHICIKMEEGGPDKAEIDAIVYGKVRDHGGSVSAEHGIGLLKQKYLGHSRTPIEMDVMRKVKAALDPMGILNPGKVFKM